MDITNIYTQKIPPTRFIGRKYGDADRVGGSFGAKWGEAHGTGLFDTVEQAVGTNNSPFFEDSGAYIGLMRVKDGEPFEYWSIVELRRFAHRNRPPDKTAAEPSHIVRIPKGFIFLPVKKNMANK